MILVDPRDGARPGASSQLVTYLRAQGVVADKATLEYGDVCFEGRGPQGSCLIGVERKTLHDMLTCIQDGRYNQQRIGMSRTYAYSFLALEGYWRPKEDGFLMEGFQAGTSWGYCRPRGRNIAHAELYNYLVGVALSGVIITHSRDLQHTAINISNIFNYFQKKWNQHTSLLEIHKPKLPAMSLNIQQFPTLTRRWAADIDGVGSKYSIEAEELFKTPIRLATSDELDWVRIGNIGAATAKKIVKQIQGWN